MNKTATKNDFSAFAQGPTVLLWPMLPAAADSR